MADAGPSIRRRKPSRNDAAAAETVAATATADSSAGPQVRADTTEAEVPLKHAPTHSQKYTSLQQQPHKQRHFVSIPAVLLGTGWKRRKTREWLEIIFAPRNVVTLTYALSYTTTAAVLPFMVSLRRT